MSDRFDVVLTGVAGRGDSARLISGLQRVFSLDLETASKLLRSAPVTVKRDASTEEAERFFHALRDLGAQVELKRKQGAIGSARLAGDKPVRPAVPAVSAAGMAAVVSAPAPGPLPAASVPSSGGPVEDLPGLDDEVPGLDDGPMSLGPMQCAPATAGASSAFRAEANVGGTARASVAEPETKSALVDDRTFWEALISALLLPIQGPGIKWLLFCTGYGAFYSMVVFGMLSFIAVGTVMPPMMVFAGFTLFLFGMILLGMIYGYFRANLWAVLTNDREPEPMREFEPTVIVEEYFKNGGTLAAFLALLQAIAFVYVISALGDGIGLTFVLGSPITWLLMFLACLYWPMGLGLMAVRTSRLAFWDVIAGYKIIALAPLEFITLTVLGTLAYFIPWVLFAVLAMATGGLALLGAPFLVGLPLAYSHGVQGALMGHLYRTRPELLE